MIHVNDDSNVTFAGNTCDPEPYDWVEDESLSREEIERRMSELEPVRLTRPPLRVRLRLSGRQLQRAWRALFGHVL